ncbi:protein REPRESSOR OF SILENCING 3 [Argentina anserina]|uniref:protein REPRESSOR OF SILENCING 3 n=1 Tax=Argentina anserina TaxID=57926 RepID=UPI00217638A3|nr:protein REPRESSOR OF SILENCING 3 [Potentilla anserina]
MANEKERIFVGGLGWSVTEDDLERLFTGVGGSVDGIDVIRTKGRSFAYVDFSPASDKSLSKLFAAYNGCVWKGGKLKVHKAKEHYLVRMRREWSEQQQDAQLAAAENTTQEAKTASQNSTKQLRLFFPALRTVKALPFSGTGKHKYSFQRIQLPSAPLHFCDCQEHAVTSPSPAQLNQLSDHVINDRELNIMNKVMDKLLQKEIQHVSDYADHNVSLPGQQHDEAEAEEDDLIINIVSNKQEEDILSALQELRSSGTQVCTKSIPPPNKKRKSLLINKYNEEELESDIPGGRTDSKSHSNKPFGAQPELGVQQSTATVSWSQKCSWRQLFSQRDHNGFSVSHILTGKSTDHTELECGTSDMQQSDRRNQDLASNENSDSQPSGIESLEGSAEDTSSKSVSDSYETGIPSLHQELSLTKLTDGTSGSVTEQANSGAFEVPHSNSKKQDSARDGNLEGQLCEMQPVEENAESQPQNALGNSNKSGRGASWCQKSSWTQLINDNTARSFSITQILPAGISFKQQGFQKPRGVDVMSSFGSKLTETVKQDKNNLTCRVSSSSGIAEKEGNGLPRHTPEENQQIIAGNDIASSSDMGKECDFTPTPAATGTVNKGKTCLFVRSAASLNEWAKTKAALSGSRKRKNTDK